MLQEMSLIKKNYRKAKDVRWSDREKAATKINMPFISQRSVLTSI